MRREALFSTAASIDHVLFAKHGYIVVVTYVGLAFSGYLKKDVTNSAEPAPAGIEFEGISDGDGTLNFNIKYSDGRSQNHFYIHPGRLNNI